jgi:hypothetical protein
MSFPFKVRNSADALVLIIVSVHINARGIYIYIGIYFYIGLYVGIYVIY